MPDLAALIQNFFATSTTLEALLAAVAVVALLTAGFGFGLRMNHRNHKTRTRAGGGTGRRGSRAASNAYEDWNVEGGIIFPSGGGDTRRERPYARQLRDEYGPESDEESMPQGGFDGIAASGERVVQDIAKDLFQPELMVLFFQRRVGGLELLNLVTVPHALEMLPCEQEHKKKNQYSQAQETETFTATLHVNFPHQAGVIDVLHKVKFRESRPARGRGVSRTPSGFR